MPTRSKPQKTSRLSKRPRGPMGNGPSGEKAKNFKGTISKLGSYLSAYLPALIFTVIFAIGGTVFNVIGPKILGNATTELFAGLTSKVMGGDGINFESIGRTLLFLLCIYILSALFSYGQGWLMTGVSQKLTYRLRKEVSEKINRMPMNYFDTNNHGEILSIITNDIDTISTSLNQSATQVITSFVTVIGILIVMFSIDWIMTLIALVILPVSMVLIMFVVKNSQKYFQSQQEYLGHVNGQVEEVFGGQNVVRVFNAEERAMDAFRKDNEELFQSAWKSQFLSGLMQPIMNFVGNLGYIAVAVVGGVFAATDRLEVGYIQSFIQYTRQFTQSISQLAQVSNLLQSTAAAAERVFEFLAEEEEVLNVENPVQLSEPEGYVSFDHVHFGYKEDKVIIHDFSTEVMPGQKIAIVGPTGAGKTTIVKLLMRFYELNSGKITIDHHDITQFDRNDLRQVFGMVLQDTWLFNGTIRENIRYGRLDASDDEVVAAAKAAHAHHFIQTLPGGYDFELNEEASNVSQGQKQLLTIARAILANPSILILDEATSSVDTRTEIQIQKAMKTLMSNRTSFVIAHRLSTIREADTILVMNHGQIVEQGKHEELLAANGFYTSLYNSQFGAAAEAESTAE